MRGLVHTSLKSSIVSPSTWSIKNPGISRANKVFLAPNDLNSRVSKARELLINGDIDAADYKTVKTENEHNINILKARLMILILRLRYEIHLALNNRLAGK